MKGSAGEGLLYVLGEDVSLWGYCDASYGSDPETRRGRSGHVLISGELQLAGEASSKRWWL